jgi:hypothetical protein
LTRNKRGHDEGISDRKRRRPVIIVYSNGLTARTIRKLFRKDGYVKRKTETEKANCSDVDYLCN